MHDCALERKREKGKRPVSAPRVEQTCDRSEISTKTKLRNHIKINGFCDGNSMNAHTKKKKNQKVKTTFKTEKQ